MKKKKRSERADGRFPASYRYTDENGVKQRKWFYSDISKSDAEKMKKEWIDEQERKLAEPEQEEKTMAEWMNDWLYKIKADDVRTKTWEDYESVNRNHIQPFLGNKVLSEITTQDVRDFLDNRKNTPVSRRKNPTVEQLESSKKRSMRSLELIYVVLNAALEQARKDRLITFNPCEPIKKPKPEEREIIPFKDEEVSSFLALAKDSFIYPIAIIAWYTGFRSSEILGLRWSMVNLTNPLSGILQVEKTTMQTRQGPVNDKPKNSSSYRTVKISEAGVITLNEHKAKQDAQKAEYGIKYQDNDLVFPKEDGSIRPNWAISDEFKRLALKAGMNPRVHFHDFRHTHATMLFKMGVHQFKVQEQMGHADLQMTRKYTHLNLTDRDEIADLLQEKMVKITPEITDRLSNGCQTPTDTDNQDKKKSPPNTTED